MTVHNFSRLHNTARNKFW